jgi:hypothetical protein
MIDAGLLEVEQAFSGLLSAMAVFLPLAAGFAGFAGLLIMVSASLLWRRH